MDSRPGLVYGALAGAVVAISFSAIFIKLAHAPAPAIAANRMLLAALLLLPPGLWLGRAELLRLRRADLLFALCPPLVPAPARGARGNPPRCSAPAQGV